VFTGAAFTPVKDRKEVAAGTGDGRIYVFDRKKKQVLPSEPEQEKDLIVDGNTVRDMAYSRDGRLVVAAYRLRGARVWDVATGKLVTSANLPPRACEANESADECIEANALRCVSFAPDPKGSRFVTTRGDGTVTVWNTEGGASVVKAPGNQAARPFCVWFEEDGQRLVGIATDGALLTGASDSSDALAPVRSEAVEQEMRGLRLGRGAGVEFDGPSGKLAVRPAPEQGDYVSVIDLRERETSGLLPLPGPRRLTNFALGGRRLGLLEADGVSVWETGASTKASWLSWLGGKREPASGGLRKLTKHGKSGSVARLSPDGFWLFVAGNTGEVSYCRVCGSTADPNEREGWRGEAEAVWADLAQDRAFAELFRCMKGKSKVARTDR
jgi:WD40 repeat protein